MTSVIPESANAHVKVWVDQERASYAVQKWEEDNAELQRQVIEDGTWVNFPSSYITRAMGMGLDTSQGRQALGKVISTCESLLARAVDLYGPMPKPGVPSGEIEEWAKPKGDCRHASFSIESWQNPNPVCNDCGEPLSKVPTSGYLHKRNPEVVPTPDGIVAVEDGQATLFSQPEEGDDDFGLQA